MTGPNGDTWIGCWAGSPTAIPCWTGPCVGSPLHAATAPTRSAATAAAAGRRWLTTPPSGRA